MSKKKKKKYICVKVRLLNGKHQVYRLPRDLQYPMWQYMKENPNNWQELLKDALVNVPVKPYKKGKSLIRVGIIKATFIKNKRQSLATRSQFLTVDNWKNRTYRDLKQYRKFLRHDFSSWNQIIIKIDVIRWWYRYRKFRK